MPPQIIEDCCYSPVYWKPTTATSTTNAPTTAVNISAINMKPNTITWTTTTNNKEQEEYVEKLEKHIDELEEDIEYFNKQLQEKDEIINNILSKNHELETNTANMDSHITYLEARLKALEDKTNEMVRALASTAL